MGNHGLRRAGPGETFWAFRPYSAGDSAQRIDWRQSAKSQDTLIREREWEVANTLWLWVNRGPRMNFKSHLARDTKAHQAKLLGLAMAVLALRAHERVGLLGSPERASSGRHMLEKLASGLERANEDALPLPGTLQRASTALLISDFLDEPDAIAKSLSQIAATGTRGLLVQVTDPAEETLPWEGRADFIGLDAPLRYKANKVQSLREDYAKAFLDQRNAVKAAATRLGFSFLLHRTDQPLAQTVLALYQRLGPS
nr:DUF58 domain-containing protein [Aestuariivirga litoralis]